MTSTLDHPAPAKDLHVSALFRKERAYAESSGKPWFILSAKYGLVSPDEVIEPYDVYLAKLPAADRARWGRTVVSQLQRALGSVAGLTIEIHASARCVDQIAGRLASEDARVLTPLSAGLGHRLDAGLIYAGLAGATRSRSEKTSGNTLWGRISGMHLGGRHDFSTFRLSLGSVLAAHEGWPKIDEQALTAWMDEHLEVLAVPVADADTLDHLETVVLRELDPPLNLMKMPKTPLRRSLSELRRRYGRRRSRRTYPTPTHE